VASITITSTADQDRGIAAAVKAANDALRAENEANPGLPPKPLWTAATFVRAAVGQLFDNWADQVDKNDLDQLRTAWQDPTKRAAIKTAAGIS
jgi:hypothetical protein